MIRLTRRLQTICASLLVLAILGSASAQGKLDKVNFLLNWTILGDHAPYYVASEKGWYEEAGLDVAISLGQGSGFTVQAVDAGKFDIGISDAPVVVAGRANGAKVKIVGIIFDKHPNNMFFWIDSGITTPQDLVGKTVAVPVADGHKVMWPAFAEMIGVDPDSVEFVNIDPAAKVSALAARRADVVFELYSGKPFMEKAIPADQLGNIVWADYGFDLYAHSYITSDRVLEERPDVIRRFLDVSYRAWQWTLENPEEAIAILAKYHPINTDDFLENLLTMEEFFQTDRYRDIGIGYIDRERAELTMEIISQYQGVDIDFDVDEMFDSNYLPDPMYKYDF